MRREGEREGEREGREEGPRGREGERENKKLKISGGVEMVVMKKMVMRTEESKSLFSLPGIGYK